MNTDTVTLQVGVKILLQNKEGKYLLLRRSLEKYPDIKGRWDIVGGRINPGTDLMENLKREVLEETGLSLEGEPKLIAAQDIFAGPDRHVVRLTYVGKAIDSPVILDTAENDMYQWLTREEMSKMEDADIYFEKLLKSVL